MIHIPFDYIPYGVSESVHECIDMSGTDYVLDMNKYLHDYPNMTTCNMEVLCLSIINYVEDKYQKRCVLKNCPMQKTTLTNVIHSDSVEHLVTIDCAIRKVGEIKMEMTYSTGYCKKCGFKIEPFKVFNDDPTKMPPYQECEACGSKQIIVKPEKCIYTDTQYITAQELQENTEHGKQPKNLICVLRSSLVDCLNAGERVKLTGVVRLKYDKGMFATMYLDVVGVSESDRDNSDIVLTDDDVKHIKELSLKPDIYDILANSICPLIYGYDQVKRAITFEVFGGTSIDLPDGVHIRGNSHILLCGDPGLAKSKLLSSTAMLIPNSVYTSGKSSSAAGLTAAAVKDETDGKWVLEAGALPLADGGVAVVDELDKMSNDDRSALHEAMEQQTITVNKAGISAQLLTRCSMLAAANPSLGKFERNIPLSNQVDLPPSLLSRFDLIYLMTDDPNEVTDMVVAKHILESRKNAEIIASGDNPESTIGVSKPIDTITFRKYLVYAKTIIPIISNEVIDLLAKEYVSMRSDMSTENSSVHIRITPRQLEALIRLSESSARIRLSTVVTVEDAQRALSLYRSAMHNISLTNEDDKDTFSNNVVLLCVPPDGIDTASLFNEVMRRSLMDYDTVNEELFKLINEHKLSINKIGNQTFVTKKV